jgi:hypothetical protein
VRGSIWSFAQDDEGVHVDDAVRELIEARAIEQLMVRYIDRIDANDPSGAADCFTPAGTGIYWGEYVGRDAIAERLSGILDAFTATTVTRPPHRRTSTRSIVGSTRTTTSTCGVAGSTSCRRWMVSGCSRVVR